MPAYRCHGMLIETRHPEWQPAVSGFEGADAQIGMPVHHAAADQRRHVAHAAPRMRGRALQPQVVPGIETARRIRRHHGERVQASLPDRAPALPPRAARDPDDRAACRTAHTPECPTPSALCSSAAFPQGCPATSRALDQHHAAEPIGIGCAIVVHPAVIRAIHAHFECDVVARRPGAEPAGRQHQVHVDAFEIHVLDALGTDRRPRAETTSRSRFTPVKSAM